MVDDVSYRHRVSQLLDNNVVEPQYAVPVATQTVSTWEEITVGYRENEDEEEEKIQVPTYVMKIVDADGHTITEWYLPRPNMCRDERIQQMGCMDVALMILQQQGRDAFTVSVEHQFDRKMQDGTTERCSTRYFGGFESEREGVRILDACNYHAYEVTLNEG